MFQKNQIEIHVTVNAIRGGTDMGKLLSAAMKAQHTCPAIGPTCNIPCVPTTPPRTKPDQTKSDRKCTL